MLIELEVTSSGFRWLLMTVPCSNDVSSSTRCRHKLSFSKSRVFAALSVASNFRMKDNKVIIMKVCKCLRVSALYLLDGRGVSSWTAWLKSQRACWLSWVFSARLTIESALLSLSHDTEATEPAVTVPTATKGWRKNSSKVIRCLGFLWISRVRRLRQLFDIFTVVGIFWQR